MIVNKTITRLLMFVIILGFAFLFLIEVFNYGSELEKLLENNLFLRLLIGFLGVAASLSTFCLWGLMFYHWGKHVFKNVTYKHFWFLAMLLGMFVGSWFYYLFVFELGKTLKQDSSNSLQ